MAKTLIAAAERLGLQDRGEILNLVHRRYVFDLSDLVQFWADNIRPTGIQRVQIEVMRELLAGNAIGDGLHIAAVCFDFKSHGWMVLPNDTLLALIHGSYKALAEASAWKESVLSMMGNRVPYVPTSGDVLINLGSSWWVPDYLHKIETLKAEFGLLYVPFIHDVIPLVTPHLCASGLVEEFRLWFRGAVKLADHIVVNSESSARDVSSWAKRLTDSCARISVVKLNASFRKPSIRVGRYVLERLGLADERFVLCVGTLEARKNHTLLFRVWSELLHSLPSEQMAKLVIVGKEGWRFDLARATLAADDALEQWVQLRSDLSDEELAELYRGCLFTVYPSFYEGWGLPLTEASSYGKLSIASDTSSIPEAASSGDILLPPKDAARWQEVISELLADNKALELATRRSAEQARLRDWSNVAQELLGFIASSTPRALAGGSRLIRDGVVYDFKVETARNRYECSALPFRSGFGWHQLEGWGAWSAPGGTEFRIETESPEQRLLYVVLKGAPRLQSIGIYVNREKRATQQLAPDVRVILRIGLPPGRREHVVKIVAAEIIDLSEVTEGLDVRRIGVGFLNLACMKTDDLASRLQFLETMQMLFL